MVDVVRRIITAVLSAGALCPLLRPDMSAVVAYRTDAPTNNEDASDRHLLVLAAPGGTSQYYARVYDDVVRFDAEYAMQVMGKDNVVILVDQAGMDRLRCLLPDDVLLLAEVGDIWMRDPTSVGPSDPVQLRYTAAAQAGSQEQADEVQAMFNRSVVERYGLSVRQQHQLFIDGGNIVDNYRDKVVTTTRFLRDNDISSAATAQALLRALLPGVSQVAVLEPDDPKLAHADGTVMFLDSNTLAVVNMDYNRTLRDMVWNELQRAFPGAEIVELPEAPEYPEWDPNFSQACGVMVNAVLTEGFLYVPMFGEPGNPATLELMRSKTSRTVVPVDASRVCKMGGSVRCLTWQQRGENARRLIHAARKVKEGGPMPAECRGGISRASSTTGMASLVQFFILIQIWQQCKDWFKLMR